MTAYAVAHMRSVDLNAEVGEYLRRIDATLDAFGGRFAVHGVFPEVVEGEWPGFLILIAFPDLDAARAWYHSPAYQEILPLRLRNSDTVALIVDGVPEGYRAANHPGAAVARAGTALGEPQPRSSARASGTPGR